MESKFLPEPISSLFDTQFEDEENVIEPSIVTKGGTTLIGGATKIGKTMITLELSRALSTQTPLFVEDFFWVPKRRRVLVLEQEIGEREFKKRGQKALLTVDRKDLDGFWYISKLPEMKLDTMTGQSIIENAIELAKPDVVILDPLSRFHNQEENSNTEMGKMFDTIDRIKKPYPDLAFILVHHFGKPYRENYDPLDYNNFRGAGKFISVVDSIICFSKEHERRVWKDDGSFYDWWQLRSRITLRHGNKIDDFVLNINREDDLRVLFDRWAEPRPIRVKPAHHPSPEPQQPNLDLDAEISIEL